MRFALFDHQGKGLRIGQALLDAGWEPHPTPEGLDVLLIDHDGPHAHPRPQAIRECHDAGAKIVLYPHGAAPTVTFYDGAYEPDTRIAARLEHGEGHLEIGRRIGRDGLNQHVVGWTYSEWQPFAPVANPTRVLFAPIQPNGAGHIPGYDRATNDFAAIMLRRTFGEVMIHNPGQPFPVQHALEAIQAAEVVVAAGTFACLALAAGKPVVMIHDRNIECGVAPHHLADYADYQRYPLTISGPESLETMLPLACAGTPEVEEWKRLFVGGPMVDIAALLERIVKEEDHGDSRPSPLPR